METNDLDKKLKLPHLLNLNEDPMLSGVLCHFLQAAVTIFGRADSQNPPSVILSGLNILKNHAIISKTNGNFELKQGNAESKIKLNGSTLLEPIILHHKDRILFGETLCVYYL